MCTHRRRDVEVVEITDMHQRIWVGADTETMESTKERATGREVYVFKTSPIPHFFPDGLVSFEDAEV